MASPTERLTSVLGHLNPLENARGRLLKKGADDIVGRSLFAGIRTY